VKNKDMAANGTDCNTRRHCESAELARDLTAPYRARVFVRRKLSLWGVSDTDTYTAALVATELVTNSVMSSAAAPDIEVRLILGRRLFASVWDGDPSPPCTREPGIESTSGRGLIIVESLSERWGWFPLGHGKTTWCVLDCAPSPRPPAHVLDRRRFVSLLGEITCELRRLQSPYAEEVLALLDAPE
jgi:anti-sigma regulatory factor (Ser/Thr protein kinase)